MKTQSEIIIYRNRSTVFEHLTEPEKLAKWSEGANISPSVSNPPNPPNPNDELTESAPYLQMVRWGRERKILHGEVTHFAQGEGFSFQLDTRASVVKVSFELQAHDGEAATRLILTQEIAPRTLLSRIKTAAIARSIESRQQNDLARLKLYLDQGGDKK